MWCGRAYVLAGVDPMNVPGRRAYLRDPKTGEIVTVEYAAIVAKEPDDE